MYKDEFAPIWNKATPLQRRKMMNRVNCGHGVNRLFKRESINRLENAEFAYLDEFQKSFIAGGYTDCKFCEIKGIGMPLEQQRI